MTQGVIDVPESIEVERMNRKGFTELAYAGIGQLKILAQKRAVWQICQGVMMRHMRDPGFSTSAFGNIFISRKPTAADHRPMRNCKSPTVGAREDFEPSSMTRAISS